MADDVARAVLRNNYQQSLSLSLAERDGIADIGPSARLVRALEARGLLDRRLEGLPSDRAIAERQQAGRPFTRPELAVLSSYAKIALLHDLLASPVPDDAYMRFLLADYFPPALRARFPAEIDAHRLGREIVATTLTNGLVNRLGAATPLRLSDETARPIAETAFAFMAAREVLGLADLWARIDALDGLVASAVQLDLYGRLRAGLRSVIAYYLRDGETARDLAGVVTRHKAAMTEIAGAGPDGALPASIGAAAIAVAESLIGAQVPADLARDVAYLPLAMELPAIADTARAAGIPVVAAAARWLAIGERFGLDRILAGTRGLRPVDDYDRLAIAGAEAALADARRRIVLSMPAGTADPARWLDERQSRIERATRDLGQIAAGDLTIARLTVAASRLGDLARDVAS
jgi:glutamate dehydrogenase